MPNREDASLEDNKTSMGPQPEALSLEFIARELEAVQAQLMVIAILVRKLNEKGRR